MARRKMTTKAKVIYILLLLGFAAMEFPGVLFFKDKVDPFILGMPFIYGYTVCFWFAMCVVLFYAYKTNWGYPKKEGGS